MTTKTPPTPEAPASAGAFVLHPKDPTAPDTYRIDGAWAPACITARDKRFTVPELLAQYWFAENMGHHPLQAATLYRFACLDSYDQEEL